MSRFDTRSVPVLVVLACTGSLALAACGSTPDAATPVSASPTDASSSPSTPQSTAPPSPASPAQPAATTSGLLGQSPTAHPNVFGMWTGKGVTSVGFTYDGNYFISPGQESTWGGVTDCEPSTSCNITVTAGRHDDPATTAWFLEHASAYGNDAGPGKAPNSMNFAFTGTITVDDDQYPFTIGQFGSGWNNDWIYGGPGWNSATGSNGANTPDGKYSVTCCSPNVTVKAN